MTERRLVVMVILLQSGELVAFTAVLSSHPGNRWALPAFLAVIALQNLALAVAGARSARRARRSLAPPISADH